MSRPAFLSLIVLLLCGCGTTQQRTGTEQLLLSDAVDRAVDGVDLTSLEGRSVYLDSTYIEPVKSGGYVSSKYIVSAIRQKLITSGCLLKSKADDADYIIEARVGALGTDGLEVTYGIPANNALLTAAAAVSQVPAAAAAPPTIPEIAIGKRKSAMSTSKVVLFAYHRETGQPVWQSGTALARSDAKDSWLFGAGPFQKGSIYDGTQFAGARLRFPWSRPLKPSTPVGLKIADSHQFVTPEALEQKLAQQAETEAQLTAQQEPKEEKDGTEVVPASHEKPVKKKKK